MSEHVAVEATELEAKRELFIDVIARVYEICGEGPFKRPGYGPTPLVELEAVLVGAAEVLQETGEIAQLPDDWQSDPALVNASTGGTNTRTMLEARINRAKQLLSE